MGLDIQIAEGGNGPLDYPFINYTATDIPANYLVAVDTTYYVSTTNTQDGIGIVLPGSGGTWCLGVTMEIIKSSGTLGTPGTAGRVRCFGPLAYCIATAAITIGAQVMADNTTAGYVKTYATSAVVLGLALTQAAAAADPILVLLSAGQVKV